MSSLGVEKLFGLKGQARELPDLPSKAIEACLEDLRFCEEHPEYFVNMSSWHEPVYHSGQCAVCLGGARLARIINDSSQGAGPSRAFCNWYNLGIKKETLNRIISMDHFRIGDVYDGLAAFYHSDVDKRDLGREVKALYRDLQDKVKDATGIRHMAPFDEDNPKDFYHFMGEMVRVLAEAGH